MGGESWNQQNDYVSLRAAHVRHSYARHRDGHLHGVETPRASRPLDDADLRKSYG